MRWKSKSELIDYFVSLSLSPSIYKAKREILILLKKAEKKVTKKKKNMKSEFSFQAFNCIYFLKTWLGKINNPGLVGMGENLDVLILNPCTQSHLTFKHRNKCVCFKTSRSLHNYSSIGRNEVKKRWQVKSTNRMGRGVLKSFFFWPTSQNLTK